MQFLAVVIVLIPLFSLSSFQEKNSYDEIRRLKQKEEDFNPFQHSPPFPYCELCHENGMFTVRDRNGLKLFSDSIEDQVPAPKQRGKSSHSWCKDVIIFQADNRRPTSEAISSNFKFPLDANDYDILSQFMSKGGRSIVDAVFMINSAYAFIHGYGFLYLQLIKPFKDRDPVWIKLIGLKYIAQHCPNAAVLYLDNDAYIRSLTSVIQIDASLVNKHGNFEIAMPIECQWMGWLNSQPQLRKCFTMDEHNHLFQTQNWSAHSHAGENRIV